MRILLAATLATGAFMTGTLASGPALADGCCILKTTSSFICVNADGATCKSHPRYKRFNHKQICSDPGNTKDIRCVNKPKGWSATEQDMEVFSKYFDGIKMEKSEDGSAKK